MPSSVIKRSVTVRGHKTSVTLENEFWQGLREIASLHHKSLSLLLDEIDSSRDNTNLSSHIRLFVLGYYTAQQARLTNSTAAPSADEPFPC